MIAWVIVLVGTLAVAAAWWWFVHCKRTCTEVDHNAHDLFRRGELMSVLTLIDAVDTRCRCERFTSGDASPHYALAQACILQLLNEGRSDEVKCFLMRARGPILKELAKAQR